MVMSPIESVAPLPTIAAPQTLEQQYDDAFGIAAEVLQAAEISRRLTADQRILVLNGLADRIPEKSRTRQYALEQAAVITEDPKLATMAASVARRLHFRERTSGIPVRNTAF